MRMLIMTSRQGGPQRFHGWFPDKSSRYLSSWKDFMNASAYCGVLYQLLIVLGICTNNDELWWIQQKKVETWGSLAYQHPPSDWFLESTEMNRHRMLMEEIMTTDTESIPHFQTFSRIHRNPRWLDGFRVSWTHPLAFSVSNLGNLPSGWTSWSSPCNV